MKIGKNITTSSSTAFAFIALVLIWGATYRGGRFAVTGDGAFPPLAAISIRYAIAAIILLMQWLLLHDKKLPTRQQLPGILSGSALIGISNVFLISALVHTSASIAAVISAMVPSFVLVLTIVHTKIKVGAGPIVGIMVSFFGIVLLSWDRLRFSTYEAFSVFELLMFALAFSVGTYICKRNSAGVDGITITTLSICNMAVVIGVFRYLLEKRPLPSPLRFNPTVALICVAIFSTVIAFQYYFRLLERTSPFVVSTVYFFQPLVALGLDYVTEHDVVLTKVSFLAIGLVLAGSILCIKSDPSRPQTSP